MTAAAYAPTPRTWNKTRLGRTVIRLMAMLAFPLWFCALVGQRAGGQAYAQGPHAVVVVEDHSTTGQRIRALAGLTVGMGAVIAAFVAGLSLLAVLTDLPWAGFHLAVCWFLAGIIMAVAASWVTGESRATKSGTTEPRSVLTRAGRAVARSVRARCTRNTVSHVIQARRRHPGGKIYKIAQFAAWPPGDDHGKDLATALRDRLNKLPPPLAVLATPRNTTVRKKYAAWGMGLTKHPSTPRLIWRLKDSPATAGARRLPPPTPRAGGVAGR